MHGAGVATPRRYVSLGLTSFERRKRGRQMACWTRKGRPGTFFVWEALIGTSDKALFDFNG